jgi:5-methylcytosine-specific restriction endonuclease McrA
MKCAHCNKEKPEEAFEGKKCCPECLAYLAARTKAPPTIPGHLRCTRCANEKPEEVFDGKKKCPECRAYLAARKIAPPTLPGHLRCTKCAVEKPEAVFDGKKFCPECLTYLTARRIAPPTLPGHLRCTRCAVEKPEEVFDGKKKCPECLASNAAREHSPAGKLARYNSNCKRRGSVGEIELPDWFFILEHFDHKCAYCASTKAKVLHKDHVFPINGMNGTIGVSWLYNIVPACMKCNSSKSDNEWQSWFRSQSFYCPIREAKIQAHMDSGILHTDRDEFAA